MKPTRSVHQHQSGALLVEVLVAMLLLAFGMLSLGAMLSFSMQMPKLSSYRAVAVRLASSHIDRIRANPTGFDFYKKPLGATEWSFETIALKDCQYPDCTEASLAAMDDAATRRAVRIALPAGDMLVTCDSTSCNKDSHGDVWVVWQDPGMYSNFDTSSWDSCPAEITRIYTQPTPRCVYVGFKL